MSSHNRKSGIYIFKMMKFMKVVVAAGFVPAVLSVPTPQMSLTPNLGTNDDIAGIDLSSYPPTETSGSLYGDSQLLGGNAAPSPISGGSPAIETNYQLVNGQEADADLGLYLDLSSVPNPQPIRGSDGSTDSGPRTIQSLPISSRSSELIGAQVHTHMTN